SARCIVLQASIRSLVGFITFFSRLTAYAFAGAVICLLVILPGTMLAQTGNASLGGIIQDPTKALIPGVTVTAKNVNTAVTATQLTNDSGIYSFPVLQPGTYEVSAELSGFKKSLQKAELPYAGQVRVNFTLELG